MNVAPTKSNLLALRKQLAFAEEGLDLLEQKRQLLVYELMKRVARARYVEGAVTSALAKAFAALTEAELDIGSRALDSAAAAVTLRHKLQINSRHLMGLEIPHVELQYDAPTVQFAFVGTSVFTDLAMKSFVEVLPLIAELAELQTAIVRLAGELRKTQRRCNALSKLFIPTHRQAIKYIAELLEERERELFIILKMIRARIQNGLE